MASLLKVTCAEGPHPPVADRTMDVKDPCSTLMMRLSYALHFSLPVVGCLASGAVGLNTIICQKIYFPSGHPRNPVLPSIVFYICHSTYVGKFCQIWVGVLALFPHSSRLQSSIRLLDVRSLMTDGGEGSFRATESMCGGE